MRSVLIAGVLALGFSGAAHSAETRFARMYVRHEVANYAAWRAVYDDLAPTRLSLGVTAQAVRQSVENLNDVTVTHDFKSAEQARAFAASPELKAAMERAGVTGTPETWITTLAAGGPGETEGIRMYIRHGVADYAAWLRTYDSFASARRRMGVTSQAVYRSADDPGDVTVTHDFRTEEQARAFASSPELRAAMEKAGVKGTPRIWFTERAPR
jgi:quinol monooxygenase YgiN